MKIAEIMAIRKVLFDNQNASFTMKTAYKIMNFMEQTNKDEEFYHKQMDVLMKKYNVKVEGGALIVDKKDTEKFGKEFDELNSTEVELKEIEFTFEELSPITSLSVAELYAFKPILKG